MDAYEQRWTYPIRLVMMSPMQDQIWMLNVPNRVEVPARFIRPSDARAPQRFHHLLSQQSIYRWFFELLSGLSEERARYFTELDWIERSSIVALDPGGRSEIVAVARIDGKPKTAIGEFAVIVEDRWQGIGVGLALTEVLFEFASHRCFRRVFAYVLPEKSPDGIAGA